MLSTILTPTLVVGVLTLIFALPGALQAAGDPMSCASQSEHLVAHYAITSSDDRAVRSLDFSRSGNRVVYSYPDQQIADQWTLTRNGYLKPTRYFIADERAIEYDAFDINRGKGVKDWEARAYWITQAKLDSMRKTGSSGEGCERVETYVSAQSGEDSGKSSFADVELSWMPELRLVKSYRLKSTGTLGQRRVMQWELQGVSSEEPEVQATIHSYDGYAATDYADIGDNESDPFLMKMIRLGFVEHGAAGFYNSDGSPLTGAHSH